MKNSLRENEKLQFITAVIALILFFLSLITDCYCTPNQCRGGGELLIMGWFGALLGGAGISWFANPFILLAFILTFKRSKYSMIFSLFGTVLSLSFLFYDKVIENEAGQYGEIISYRIGYWFWNSSSILLLICNVIFTKPKNVDNRF